MKIDVWSDFTCPFCYLGESHLKQALAEVGLAAELNYHSYELEADAHYVEGLDYQTYMVERQSMPEAQVDQIFHHIAQNGAASGLDFNFAQAIPANTFTAHRIFQYAKEVGQGQVFFNRLYQAHFTEGLNIEDAQTLRELSEEIGLDLDQVEAILLDDSVYYEAVNEDIQQAVDMDLEGVPFYVFNDQYAVAGAQPVAYFVEALKQIEAEA